MIFLGAGETSKREIKKLHQLLDAALFDLGALQQPQMSIEKPEPPEIQEELEKNFQEKVQKICQMLGYHLGSKIEQQTGGTMTSNNYRLTKTVTGIYKRIGTFSISSVFVNKYDPDEPDYALQAIMSKVVVLEARFDWARDAIIYTALSPMFDEIPIGQEAPRYDLIIHEDRDGVDDLGKTVVRYTVTANRS